MLKAKPKPPLFSSGITDIDIDDLFDVFVKEFNDQSRRIELVSRFSLFYKLFNALNIPHEIWIDGSFCTKEENPSDIDAIILLNRDDLLRLSHEQNKEFFTLTNPATAKARYHVDVRLGDTKCKNYRAHFTKWFGTDKEDNEKGFVRLRSK